jgi:hypothetical protein
MRQVPTSRPLAGKDLRDAERHRHAHRIVGEAVVDGVAASIRRSGAEMIVMRGNGDRPVGGAAASKDAPDVAGRYRWAPHGRDQPHLGSPPLQDHWGGKSCGEAVEIGIIPGARPQSGKRPVERDRHPWPGEYRRERRSKGRCRARVGQKEPRLAAGGAVQPVPASVVHHLDDTYGTPVAQHVRGGSIGPELATHERHPAGQGRQVARPPQHLPSPAHVRQLACEVSQRAGVTHISQEIGGMLECGIHPRSGDVKPGPVGHDRCLQERHFLRVSGPAHRLEAEATTFRDEVSGGRSRSGGSGPPSFEGVVGQKRGDTPEQQGIDGSGRRLTAREWSERMRDGAGSEPQ